MAANAQYASVPLSAAVKISTANPNRDGTGTIGTLLTAGASGCRVDDLYISAQGATTAGVVRMYLFDGATYYLLQEMLVVAVTPSTSTPVWSMFLPNLGIVLQNGWSLRFSTNNAESFVISATRAGSF